MRTLTARPVAVLGLAALLALGGVAGGQAASRSGPVLALTYVSGSGWSRLGQLDPLTLRPAGKTLNVGRPIDSWAFSPDGRQVALASRNLLLTIVDTQSLAIRIEIRLAARGLRVQALTWLRPTRLVAVVALTKGMLIVAVDPQTGAVVRSTSLRTQYGYALGHLRDGVALRLDNGGRVAPARVAFVNANGRVRIATVKRILTGSTVSRRGRIPRVRERTVGFAADPAAGRVYVVDRSFAVAEIDARTLGIRYHTPTVRTVAAAGKLIEGSSRVAAWLGNGVLAAAGVDWKVEGQRSIANPHPIRLIDVRSWSYRPLEARSAGFRVVSGLVMVQDRTSVRAFASDGTERWRARLPSNAWLVEGSGLLYVCRSLSLIQVLDAATGAVLRTAAQLKDSPCAEVMVAEESPGSSAG